MEKQNSKSKITKIIVFFILVVLVISIILLYVFNVSIRAFMDKYIFRKEISEEDLVQIDISDFENAHFSAYKDKILILAENVLHIYDDSGKEKYTINVEITKPIFKVYDDFLCIAEKEGKKVYLISGENVLWQKETENPINNIEINKKGYVAVCTEGTSYKSIICLYNSDGEEILKTFLSTTNVVSMALSDDNKFLALGEVNFSGSLVKSNIKIVNIEQENQNSQQNNFINYSADEGTLITKVRYIDDILVCMTDKGICKIEDSQIKEIVNYSVENILFATIEDDIKFVKEINSNLLSSEIEIISFNIKDASRNTYKIDKEPKSVFSYKNLIAVNTGTQLIIVNEKGWLSRNFSSNHEINNIVLTDRIVGVIYKNVIGIIKF